MLCWLRRRRGFFVLSDKPNNFATNNCLNILIFILPCCNFVNRRSVYNRNSQKESDAKFSVPFDCFSNWGGIRNHLVGIISTTLSFVIFNNSRWFYCCERTKREIIVETTAWATRVTKISMGAPSRERLVLLHAWPHGDFFESTRASQRVQSITYLTYTYASV